MNFDGDKKLVDMLCVAYAYELQAYHGYLHAYTTVTGPLESIYGDIYKSFMEKELHHLEEVGKKIRVMGGMPPIKYPPITLVEEAVYKGYDETLEALQKGEEKALEIYTKIHSAADKAGDLPLVILIEEIIQEEEEHHDEIARILMDAPKQTVEKHDKLVVDAFAIRRLKLAQLMRDPESVANAIITMINTLATYTDGGFNFSKSVKNNIAKISAGQLSSQQMSGGALVGQAINFIKAALRGQDNQFITNVLNKIMVKL